MPEDTVNKDPEAAVKKGGKFAKPRKGRPVLRGIGTFILAMICIFLTASVVGYLALTAGIQNGTSKSGASDAAILDKFDMYMTNEISEALDGVLAIKKSYWLSDADLVAPKPDPANYGTADSPSELMWLLEEAAELIDGQEMLFNENTPVWEGDKIYYYYDETILVITWKQIIDRCAYTISEVKVAHASQFRRGLADGEFGSDKQYVPTDIAKSVNAVVATSGDFYKFRRSGAIVYQSELRRFAGKNVDACYITEEGDMLFTYRGQMATEEQARQFVEDNKVRFSLCFGPILIDDGEVVAPATYPLGEVDGQYSRAAVCQMDKLHYMFVNLCSEKGYDRRVDMVTFANEIAKMGAQKAYALDGGQTTVIAMDGELISNPDYGEQRAISDIIYFATALPNGE